MNTVGKVIIAGISIFGLAKLFQLYKMNQTSDALIININNTMIHSVDLTGITVKTNVTLVNPTKNSLNITQPFIEILSDNSPIINSNIQNKLYVIKPQSEITLDTITLKIGILTLLGLLSNLKISFPPNYTLAQKTSWLVTNYKSFVQKLNLKLKYSTYANGLYHQEIQQIGI